MSLRKAAFGFAPTSITGCSLWMDGADSSTMTTASSYISAWNSKGTNALSFTQATSSQRPLLVNNVYNGNSVVRCINPGNNVVNVNITSVNNSLLQTGASFCIFIIHNPTINNGSPFCFQTGGSNRISCHLTENGNVVFDTPNIRLTYAAPGNYLTSGLKLDVFWSVANAINYRAFGSATASASAAASTWTDGTLTFGSFTPTQADYYYQTDIGEIIWFNTAITLTQVQQVESYLAQKWGLTSSLAAGHPGLTTTVYRSDYIKNSVIVRNVVKPIPYFTTFSPRQISGLGLWLDAADSSTVTGTSPITAWTDKSGAGRTVTITSGPTYGTTSQAGNRTMSFNNNTITTSIASAVGTGDFTLVAVWYQSAAGTNTVLSLGTVASSSQSLGFSGNKYNFYQFGDVNESAYSTATPSWVVQIGTRIGSVKKVYINGNVGTTPSSTSYDASVTTVTIGKGDNFAISGEVGEILIYTGTISDTSRQLLESYLAQKWGLTASLPGGHSHFTQRTGAITRVANTKFTMTGVPRITFTATGGTIVTSEFKYHLFTSSSNFVVSMDSKTVNYLVVGGGGGGGDRHGAGGGGGGVLTGTWTASVGTYTVTVGLGGAAGNYSTNNSTPRGAGIKGGNSSLSGTGVSVTANGGGGGGTYDGNPTGTVGSGGGGGGNGFAGVAGTAGQGNSGGSGLIPAGGGGGGAGGVGANANTSTGGIGTTSFSTHLLAVGYGTSFAVPTAPNVVISGGVAYIAAGGGGSPASGPGPGGSGGLGGGALGHWDAIYIQAGTSNTGGGGGGSRVESGPSFSRDGGSGLVLLWYAV